MKKYLEYKPANLTWLEEVPRHWEIKRAGILFNERKTKNDNYEIKKAFQFKFGQIVEKKQLGTEGELKGTYEKYTKVYKNDIIINGLNLNYDFVTQRVGLVKKNGIITSAYISLDSKDFVNPKYACYLFKSIDNVKMFNGMGTGIRLTLSYSELKKQYLPLPTINEQDQIVKFLDSKISKINKFIKAKKREIELLKELKQAEINRAVTKGLNPNVPMKDSEIDWLGEIPEHWDLRRLKTFCDFVNRGVTPSYTEEKLTMVVNQATFSKGYWDTSNIRYTNSKVDDNRGILHKDDVLIASTGGGVLGKTFLYKLDERFIADSHVTILRDSDKRFVPEYMYYLLSINYDLINGRLSQGSTNQIELQRNWLTSMRFPYPSISEQKDIAESIVKLDNKIDKIIDGLQKQILRISEYKTSLISDVVTGKVDVREIAVDNEMFEEEVLEEIEKEQIDE